MRLAIALSLVVLSAPVLAIAGAGTKTTRHSRPAQARPGSLLALGRERSELPGVLRCRAPSAGALRCRTVPSSSRGVVYVLFGEWRRGSGQSGRMILVDPLRQSPSGGLTMIASGRLGALACPPTTAATRTCRPLSARAAPRPGDFGIYLRKEL